MLAVMRTTSLRVSLGGLAVLGALVCIARFTPEADSQPHVGFSLLGYSRTNRVAYTEELDEEQQVGQKATCVRFDTSQPNGKRPFRRHESVLLARVRLQNTGSHAIVYESQTSVPEYSCLISSSVSTNVCTYYQLSGGPVVLEAGKTVDFWVWLPPDVLSWEVSFTCSRAPWQFTFADRHPTVVNHLPSFVDRVLLPIAGQLREHEARSKRFAVPEGAGNGYKQQRPA